MYCATDYMYSIICVTKDVGPKDCNAICKFGNANAYVLSFRH